MSAVGFLSKLRSVFRRDSSPSLETTVPVRLDGWASALLGYGVAGIDKRLSSEFMLDVMDSPTAEALWRSNDVAARIIEKVPAEALRAGFSVRMDDKESAELLSARFEELQVEQKFYDALCKERAFGGSAIFPVARDTSPQLDLPLREHEIAGVSHLQVFEARELKPATWYTDPLDPKFGEPETYWLFPRARGGVTSGHGTLIHESRLIVCGGVRVSRDQVSAESWGDSVLQRPHDVLRDFGVSWAAVGVMLTDFSQATMSIKGLAELIAQDKDEVIRNRLKAVELARSTVRMTLVDAEEQYERKQTPVSGLADLLDRFESRLAAAADMPITVLMGRSPAGLNATGESDIRLFYDRVGVYQRLTLRPRLERLVGILMRDRLGPTRGREPDTWSVEFAPLWQPSAQEQATTRKTIAETDQVYYQMGAVSADEIARSRWGGDSFSPDMSIDFENRASLEEPISDEESRALINGETDPVDEKDAAPVSDDEIQVTVEEVDPDGDGESPPEEYAVIKVRGHTRRVRLKRRPK